MPPSNKAFLDGVHDWSLEWGMQNDNETTALYLAGPACRVDCLGYLSFLQCLVAFVPPHDNR